MGHTFNVCCDILQHVLNDTGGPSTKFILLTDVDNDWFNAATRCDDATAGHDVLILRLPCLPLQGQLLSLGGNGKLHKSGKMFNSLSYLKPAKNLQLFDRENL